MECTYTFLLIPCHASLPSFANEIIEFSYNKKTTDQVDLIPVFCKV